VQKKVSRSGEKRICVKSRKGGEKGHNDCEFPIIRTREDKRCFSKNETRKKKMGGLGHGEGGLTGEKTTRHDRILRGKAGPESREELEGRAKRRGQNAKEKR